MNGMILSHIPVHTESLARFRKNVHGHLHGNQVMKTVGFWPFKKKVVDPRYFCVCVENTDFRPISLEDVIARMKKRDEEMNFSDDRAAILGPD